MPSEIHCKCSIQFFFRVENAVTYDNFWLQFGQNVHGCKSSVNLVMWEFQISKEFTSCRFASILNDYLSMFACLFLWTCYYFRIFYRPLFKHLFVQLIIIFQLQIDKFHNCKLSNISKGILDFMYKANIIVCESTTRCS